MARILSDDDWKKFRGQFISGKSLPNGAMTDVKVTTEPTDEDVFPILCGRWPNENIGARQARCSCCREFVGISPKGWELYRRNTERLLMCVDCAVMLNQVIREMES